jgi:aminocarboxymuconate-semialdehyde decarboxylase
VVHGGGFAPYQIGRWDRGVATDFRGAAEHLIRSPGEWLRTLYFDTVLHSDRSLQQLVDVLGAERVVLGSDYPFVMGEPTPVNAVAALSTLTDRPRHLILRGNGAALLDGVRR